MHSQDLSQTDGNRQGHTNLPWPTASAVPANRMGIDVRQVIRTAVDIIERKRAGEIVPDSIALPTCSEEEATQAQASGSYSQMKASSCEIACCLCTISHFLRPSGRGGAMQET